MSKVSKDEMQEFLKSKGFNLIAEHATIGEQTLIAVLMEQDARIQAFEKNAEAQDTTNYLLQEIHTLLRDRLS